MRVTLAIYMLVWYVIGSLCLAAGALCRWPRSIWNEEQERKRNGNATTL